jgi:hypothetical protein
MAQPGHYVRQGATMTTVASIDDLPACTAQVVFRFSR